MARKKTSEFDAASALTGAETVAVVQSGADRRTTVQDITNTANSSTPTQAGFWSDLDASAPRIHRFRDRVFIGDAVETNDRRITGSVKPDWGSYASWAPRDADFVSMSSRGAFAVVGMSRSSDAIDTGGSVISTMGVGGFAIVDRASSTARPLYSDLQFESGASYGYGLEIAAKNKGDSYTSTPYSAQLGVYGIYAVAGGDPVYGGTAANPCNAFALVMGGGPGQTGAAAYRWNKGIVFSRYALTGSDGTGASDQRAGVAIEMAAGQLIKWQAPGDIAGASITSSIATSGKSMSVIFQDDTFIVYGGNGKNTFRAIHAASVVNGLEVRASTTTNAPSIRSFGDDTNVDLLLVPKGSGNVSYGTHTGNADAAITGYITIKDSGGTTRKLAVIT